MPARMSLHWDGKMLQDLSGELKEVEAIIVCWRELHELRDLVTPNSCQLFKILEISPDWLALPPAQWDFNLDYMEFRNFMRTVNDCAERGVKLATDYSKSLTKDSQERSRIYQVVEAERRAKPDAKKATLNK